MEEEIMLLTEAEEETLKETLINFIQRVMAKDAGSIEEFQAQIAIIPYIVAMLCPRD